MPPLNRKGPQPWWHLEMKAQKIKAQKLNERVAPLALRRGHAPFPTCELPHALIRGEGEF
jgi:hypothetical protein